MEEVSVQVESEINPTEDKNKVKCAIENLFGNSEFEIKFQKQGRLVVGKGKGVESLTKLQNLLSREKIRDAARRVFYGGLERKSIVFYLNKQVAYVGRISFSNPLGESPLGPIKVQIQCDDPHGLIDWLAPRTK